MERETKKGAEGLDEGEDLAARKAESAATATRRTRQNKGPKHPAEEKAGK
jgi:hypothetical protein